MNEIKTLLLLGGTGFVGRAVTEEYLRNGWHIIIPTRDGSIDKAMEKLISHGFDKYDLDRFIKGHFLSFALNIDFIDRKWLQINNWLRLFSELNVPALSILQVINLVGETTTSASEIAKSNIDVLKSIFTVVQYLKSQNKNVLFCNMGSTAEKKKDKNSPPYERAKTIARQQIEESNLCDYHFVANYIKGRGEQKMKSAAPFLWNKLKFSRNWLFGFKVSIIDVDDLAEIIYRVLEVARNHPWKQKPIEVNVTNGELSFGEVIMNLLPENRRVVPKPIIPAWLERYFLRLYAFTAPRLKPNNQLIGRLADFAKRGTMSPAEQQKSRTFKNAEEIKKLSANTVNYLVLETSPNLIIVQKHLSLMYVLREKSQEELKQIVQKAVVFSN